MQFLTSFSPWKAISFLNCSFNCQYPLPTYEWNLKEHFTTADINYFAISPFVRRNISCYYLKTLSGTYLFSWARETFSPFMTTNGEKKQFWKTLISFWRSIELFIGILSLNYNFLTISDRAIVNDMLFLSQHKSHSIITDNSCQFLNCLITMK